MSLNFLFGNVDQEGHLDLDGIDDSFKETLAEVGSVGDDESVNSFLEMALGGSGFSLGQDSVLDKSDSDSVLKLPKKTGNKRKRSVNEDLGLSDSSFSRSAVENSPYMLDDILSPSKNSDPIVADADAIDYSNIDEDFFESEDDLFESKNLPKSQDILLNKRVEFYDYDSETNSDSSEYLSETGQVSGKEHKNCNSSLITKQNKEDIAFMDHSSNLKEMIRNGKPLKFTDIFGSFIEKKTRSFRKIKNVRLLEQSIDDLSQTTSTINNLNFEQLSTISIKDNIDLAFESGLIQRPAVADLSRNSPLNKIYLLNNEGDDLVINQIPFGLEIDEWEKKIIWNEQDKRNFKTSTGNIPTLEKDNKMIKPINTLFDSGKWLDDVVWDLSLKNKRIVFPTNTNDPLMAIDILEQKNPTQPNNLLEKEKLSLETGIDRFNLSNDIFYDALQEGKVQRVRQTFGQLLVMHSLPSVHLQPPLFRIKFSRYELRNWHRPKLFLFPKQSSSDVPPPQKLTIKFSKLKSKKRKKKSKNSSGSHDDSLWSSSDITLRDSADMILIEYSEEYPPIMSNVGMGAVLVNYYRKTDEQDTYIPDVKIGDLFILGIADASPFLNFGNVMPGQTIAVLHNNMFRAPLFPHNLGKYSPAENRVRSTDFLAIRYNSSKWYLRSIPNYFLAGQTYPVLEVPAPHSRRVTTIIKNRLQIASYRLINENPHQLLNLNKLTRMFPEYSDFQIRQRLKEFCEYQRRGLGTGFWRAKANIPVPSEESLRSLLTPEMMCLFESMLVSQLQLIDSGCSNIFPSSNSSSVSQGISDSLSISRVKEQDENIPKLNDDLMANLDIIPQAAIVNPNEEKFASWNTTRNFINATQGKAMLQLCGEGDSTGMGSGFSFLRVSMKDIFLRAGESITEKLAEIEARPKSAHRYNVAEQQEIYREEIMKIWNAQFNELSCTEGVIISDNILYQNTEAYDDEVLIIPPSLDYHLPLAIPLASKLQINETEKLEIKDGQDGKRDEKPLELRIQEYEMNKQKLNTAGEVKTKKQKTNDVISFSTDELANTGMYNSILTFGKPLGLNQSSFPGRLTVPIHNKQLVIKRTIKSPYTGDLTIVNEVIKDVSVIETYLRSKSIIAKSKSDEKNPIDYEKILKARDLRKIDQDLFEKTHMTTFSLPPPNKSRKEVVRKCGNCGLLGHMKTNKKCPRYFEFNAV
ncbi:putative transcription initiation factor TFIID 111 kDa subunit [Smittium mucronatum]|uniref:Putative transcription initiation factor TFIID 111 kDa subunit n=1 Tax=Smittium mucronatum TaxID=133383 RepID=A0A1R0H2H7_9FUNG|nr:putative transcription initiation factor TFIID 111 kDa subunit [Smittium mucronatum]